MTLTEASKANVLDELQFMFATSNLRYVSEKTEDFTEPLDFATPKKEKNCKLGTPCGKSCISGKKICRKKPSPEVKEKIEELTEILKNKANYDELNDKAALDPDLHRLYDLASGAMDPASMTFTAEEKQGVVGFVYGNYDEKYNPDPNIKAAKIVKAAPSITSAEGLALGNWTSNNYGLMNKRIYDPGFIGSDKAKKAILNLDEMAAVALYKLPPVTTAQVKKEAAIKGETFDESKPLTRYLKVDDPDEFVKRYQDSLDADTPYTEPTFFATTHLDKEKMGYFARSADIKYTIKAKLDGTGAGRYIDHFKNEANEGEILYPPMSKFRVNKVIVEEQLELTEAEGKAFSDWNHASTALAIKNAGMPAPVWKAHYKENTGQDFPKKADLVSMEALYKQVKQKQNKFDEDSFGGYIIELEEI